LIPLKAKSVIINGSNLNAEAGQADFSFGAGNIGEHPIKVLLILMKKMKKSS
jgi:hypothetical protein